MANSEASIASLALKIMADKGITSLGDATNSASLMNDLYPVARDLLQSLYPWKFCINRVTLNQLTTVPLNIGSVNTTISQRQELPNRFAYSLPANYIRMIETGNDPNPFKIENIVTNVSTGASQPCVISDDSTLVIRYIARMTDVTQFTPAFVWALVTFLATYAAIQVTGSVAKMKAMNEIHRLALQDARTVNSFEQSEDILITSIFTTDVR